MDIVGAFNVLVRLAETGSFSAVGRQLGSTQSSISRQIDALEANFGARLVQRTTRQTTLTDEGRKVLIHARAVLGEVEEARASVGKGSVNPTGHVRLAVTVGLSLYLASRVQLLLSEYPNISLELVTAEHMPDLVKSGLDLALRYGDTKEPLGQSLVTKHLGSIHSTLLAAPSYVESHEMPHHPNDLIQHECISYALVRNQQRRWRFKGEQGEVTVEVTGRFHADNSESVHSAVLSGLGLAVLPEVMARDDVMAGRLVPVMQDWQSLTSPIIVVYPCRRNLPMRTRVVLDFLEREIHKISYEDRTGGSERLKFASTRKLRPPIGGNTV